MNDSAPARDQLDDKVNRVFAGKVVRKDLVRKVKENGRHTFIDKVKVRLVDSQSAATASR